MSQQQDQPTPPGHRPTAQIHDAHERSLTARQHYISAAMSDAGQQVLGYAHGELQRSVLRYLEAMKYLLRTKATIQKYWHGQPPEDDDAALDDGAALLSVRSDERHLPESWVAQAKADLQADREPGGDNPAVTPEDIATAYRESMGWPAVTPVQLAPSDKAGYVYRVRARVPTYGLKHLADQWQSRRPVTETKTGLLGVRSVTRERPERLPPDVLLRAGTALDEAADALGLLAAVDEDENLPMITGFDTSGEEIEGELKYGQYNRSPDL